MIRKKTDSGWWEGELQVEKYIFFLTFPLFYISFIFFTILYC